MVEALRRWSQEPIELAHALNILARAAALSGSLTRAETAWTDALAAAPSKLDAARCLFNLGNVARERNDLSVAYQRYEASLAIHEAVLPDTLEAADVMNNLGGIASRLDRLGEATNWHERALSIRERLAPDSLAMAMSLNNLGTVAQLRGNYLEAKRRHEAALMIQEQIQPKSLDVARSLNNLGIAAMELMELGEARRRHEAALALYQELDPDSLAVARSLNNLGNVAEQAQDLLDAQRRYHAALAIRKRLVPRSLEVASCLINLGNTAFKKRDLGPAQEYFNEAHSILQVLPFHVIETHRCLTGLGNVTLDRGDLDVAQEWHRKALAIAEKHLPGSQYVAVSLNNLGRVARTQGDLDEAQMRYEAVLALDQISHTNSFDSAKTLANLGVVAKRRGDLAMAQRRFEEALAIFEIVDPTSLEVAVSLSNLGTVDQLQGNFTEAQRRFEAALVLQERVARESPEVVASFTNLGTVARLRGNLTEAQTRFEVARALQERLGPTSLAMAAIMTNLGNVASDQGDLVRAQRWHEAALIIAEKLAPRSDEFAANLSNLWIIAAERNDQAELRVLSAKRLELSSDLLTGQGTSRASDLGPIGTEASNAIKTVGALDSPQSFYPWLPTLRAAGLTLQTRAKISELAAGTDEEVRKARSAVQIATKQETAWITNPRPKDMDEKAWDDELLDRRAKRQSAELKLATLLKDKDPRLTTDLKIEQADVQKAIPEGALLIEYLRVATWDDKAKKPGPNAYAAFVVPPKGDVRYVRLAPAEEIDKLVEAWQEQMANATPSGAGAMEADLAATEKELRKIGRALHDKLIKPLGKLPANLLIAPDDRLHALPFAALVDGKGKYLIETITLSLVGSGRDLVEKPIAAEPGPAVVIAGPDFGAEVEAVENANKQAQVIRAPNAKGEWDPLPSAGPEGEAIAKLLGTEPITGTRATEEMLLGLQRPRVLHIATHGFFFPPTIERKDREEFLMSDLTGRGMRVADNPMLRSGLILAGANKDEELRKAGLADGWATALEISLMDLRGTELVVLSACDTARGDTKGAEGVFGLQRALRFAGAQTLVMSLFKVPDAATRALMESFYRAWSPGAPAGTKLTALRAAQLAMLKDKGTRHPRNWAGFVLMGER